MAEKKYPSEQRILLEALATTKTVPVAIVSGTPLETPCRALLVGTEGTATLTDAGGGVAVNVPLQQGYNPIGGIVQVTLVTALNVWALY